MPLTAENRGDLAHVRDAIERILRTDKNAARPLSPATQIVTDMVPREIRGYSLLKGIDALVNQDPAKMGLVREVSDALEKGMRLTRRSASSFFMPTHLPFEVDGIPRSRMLQTRAAYQVGTASQGGNLVETELLAASFIEVLRNASVTGQLGARYLTGLTGNVNIPRQNSQTQTYWVGESVALTESEATFDQVQLRPHVVGSISRISRLMLQQATPAMEQIAREDLMATAALAVDLAAINGTGTNSQPTGILNTANITSVIGGTNGANLTFDMMVQLYAGPLVANAPMENMGYAFSGLVKGYLSTLKSTTGQYLWNPSQTIAGAAPDSILGYKYAVSTQMPSIPKGTSTACRSVIFGNWKELMIGEWGVAEIMVNPYDSAGFVDGDVLIRCFQTVDVGLRHPAAFSAVTDALTPGF